MNLPSQPATLPDSYGQLVSDIKERIRTAQYAALRTVNRELIELYWNIGRLIVERQTGESWGSLCGADFSEGSPGRVSGHHRLFGSQPVPYAAVL